MKTTIITLLLFMVGFSQVNAQSTNQKKDTTAEAVDFQTVANPPVYPGCGTEQGTQAKSACFGRKIRMLIAQNFDASVMRPDSTRTDSIILIRTQFTIGTDGSLTKIKATTPNHQWPLLEREAIRVLRLIPQIKPGEMNGKPVPVRYVLPIRFAIQ